MENNFIMTAYQIRRRRRQEPMRLVRITYDSEGDILYLAFDHPTAAIGYQLSDQLLLRVDPQTQRLVGLTIFNFNFSVHVKSGRQLPLPGIEADPETKPLWFQILATPPIAHFLRVVVGQQEVSAVLLRPSLQEAVVG
jgi:uncharacterized protein YuzE